MRDNSELKRLAEATGSVEWKWWDSNSTLRLTTESGGRHSADGDAISAYRDSVQCPEVFRSFIEAASPAAVSALIAEKEALRHVIQAITAQVEGNIRPTVRDCVNGKNNIQDIYGYCDQIEAIAAAAMKEPQP